MYIDKIYTKLYSNKDWNGLNQLVNEIKAFSSNPKLKDPELRKALSDEFRALNRKRKWWVEQVKKTLKVILN